MLEYKDIKKLFNKWLHQGNEKLRQARSEANSYGDALKKEKKRLKNLYEEVGYNLVMSYGDDAINNFDIIAYKQEVETSFTPALLAFSRNSEKAKKIHQSMTIKWGRPDILQSKREDIEKAANSINHDYYLEELESLKEEEKQWRDIRENILTPEKKAKKMARIFSNKMNDDGFYEMFQEEYLNDIPKRLPLERKKVQNGKKLFYDSQVKEQSLQADKERLLKVKNCLEHIQPRSPDARLIEQQFSWLTHGYQSHKDVPSSEQESFLRNIEDVLSRKKETVHVSSALVRLPKPKLKRF